MACSGLALSLLLASSDAATPALRAAQACTPQPLTAFQGNGFSELVSLSGDGRFIAFDSLASDLTPGDNNGVADVFVYDRQTCAMEMVSVDSTEFQGDDASFAPSISDDGRFVAFGSNANNLVGNDTNGFRDIFLRDRTLGTTVRVSVTSTETEVFAGSFSPAISGNGLFVAFRSFSAGLVANDTNLEDDIFVRDVVNGTTERASVGTGGVQGESVGNEGVDDDLPAISNDGRYVAFGSRQHTFLPLDNNNSFDVFMRDRQTDTTTLVSQSTAGQLGVANSKAPSMSGDGRYVAFNAIASNLVAGDLNESLDVFVRDTVALTTTRVSLVNQGGEANADSFESSISDDGRYVTFSSLASDLVAGDTNLAQDVFLHDRTLGITRRVSASLSGVQTNGASRFARMSANGLFVGFESFATNVSAPDPNGAILDAFVVQWGAVSVPSDVELVRNGDFSNGTTNWLLFATPDMTYMVSTIVNGVFEFFRLPPPPGTANQAVVFQQTTAQLQAFSRLEASFVLGNSSTARKRVSVLIHDADFSDLFVCTFFLQPNAPLRTYTMRTHTTKGWANATISFYAATHTASGGAYQLDDVSLTYRTTGATDESLCGDPTTPAAPGGASSGNLLLNGDFGAGLAPWGTFGQIVWQLASGVFEFYRTAGLPAGVVLQASGDAMSAGQIMTATFDLGNSSSVRKRVTLLLHDGDFSDLVACTFWLPPSTPLQTYTVRTFTTEAWTDATFSLYGATVGTGEWIRFDNASLERTPAQSVVGTECYEPGALPIQAVARPSNAPRGVLIPSQPSRAEPSTAGSAARPELGPGRGLVIRVPPSDAPTEVQVSADGVRWDTITIVEPNEDWTWLRVDVAGLWERRLLVRLVKSGGPK